MNLRQQLARLNGVGLNRLAPSTPTSTPPMADEVIPAPESDAELEPRPHPTPHGTVHLRAVLLPSSHSHGNSAIAPAADCSREHLRILALDDAFLSVPTTPLLFLDTETTGLAGGTGTLPFLVGLAGFADGTLWMEQLFLKQPGAERALLLHLRERMADSAVWVTFNGKSFDWPLLRTRFVMNRLAPPPLRPHLDLLYASRRTFRPRVQSSRLVELEQAVLAFAREGDIPGHEIPERYFRFLRQGRLSEVLPILRHNAWDLIALAGLLAYFIRALDGDVRHPWDAATLGAVAFRAGNLEMARRLCLSATQAGVTQAAGAAWEVLAAVDKKEGRLDRVAHALEQAASQGELGRRPQIHLELAKLFEHRLRDLSQARKHAAHGATAESTPAHLRRMNRLERKTERAYASSNLQKRLV